MGECTSGKASAFYPSNFKNGNDMKTMKVNFKVKMTYWLLLVLTALLLLPISLLAQDGIAGINEANQQVRSYFDAGTDLMYAVGAILGLIGAVKVYQKWNAGDPDTGKVAAAWFGSCVFLVVVATVIQSFFGI
jgi:hypothetical protein